MRFEGDPEVLSILWEKRELMSRGDARANWFRPALLILGGTMRGILGAAKCLELELRGFSSCFDNVIGVSTGTPVAAYFCAYQSELAIKLYLEEGLSREFIDVRRAFVGRGPVNCDYAASIFRGETNKRLDQDAARLVRAGLWAAASHSLTGRPHLVDLKKQEDMVHGIRASIAIPGSSQEIWVDGIPTLDGSVSCPLPVQLAWARFRPTHLLVFANRPEFIEDQILAGFFERYVMRSMASAFANAMRSQEARFHEELAWLRAQDNMKWAVIWSDDSLRSLTRDHQALYSAMSRAREFFADLLLRTHM